MGLRENKDIAGRKGMIVRRREKRSDAPIRKEEGEARGLDSATLHAARGQAASAQDSRKQALGALWLVSMNHRSDGRHPGLQILAGAPQ